MLVEVVAAHIKEELQVRVGLVVEEMLEHGLDKKMAQMEIPILVVGRAVLLTQVKMVEQAAPVLSSSRPINNEGAWKLKSIGCMESTPQCIC
jgi:hypothetical protein